MKMLLYKTKTTLIFTILDTFLNNLVVKNTATPFNDYKSPYSFK